MRIGIALLIASGCGRFAFDSVPAPDAPPTADSDPGTAEMLVIGAPDSDAQVLGMATLTGSCKTGIDVVATGDITTTQVGCPSGAFSVDVSFTAGNGDKYVTLTQGADSVTRHFVRVGAAIVHRSSATGTAPSAGFNVDCTLMIGTPAGVAPGDVLIGMIYTDGSSTSSIATPGWTRLALSAGMYVAFYKTASIEPTAYSFPITVGPSAGDTCESAGVISAFSGANTSTPIAVESPAGGQLSTTITAPSFAASQPGMLVALFGSNGPATGMTAPAGMTNDPTAISAGDWADALLAWQPIASGATGTRTTTLSQTRDGAASLVELVP